MKFIYVLISVLPFIVHGLNEEIITKLDLSIKKVTEALKKIEDEWSIQLYPLFLKSCAMHKSSWEILKLKYMQKVLSGVSSNKKENFVISFLGSSVTAGHDSPYNKTTVVVTEDYMRDAFASINIDLSTRGVALGNNPCVPYDICVNTFAGLDADIVHWEQTYFCWDSWIFELFIRQAMSSPNHPVVIFSESGTHHWKPEECDAKKDPHVVTSEEKSFLTAEPLKIVTEMNKDELKKWHYLSSYHHRYKAAGIQVFGHTSHAPYACLGPYIRTWEAGAASWHPSIVAHRLRAAHHAYFWLICFREALTELKSSLSHRALDAVSKDVQTHLNPILSTPLGEPIHKTAFVDGMKCYTDYEPRSVREASLKSLVISGMAADATAKGWKFDIHENLNDVLTYDRIISVPLSLERGYKDYKYMLYTLKNTIPLSIYFQTEKAGPVFLCQTPGIWGKLPKDFTNLWESDVQLYLTKVKDKNSFTFDPSSATVLKSLRTKEFDICMQVFKDVPNALFSPDSYVITIVPKETSKVIVGWLLTA